MSNKQIVNLIEERLEKGKREYSEQLDVHDGRDWTQESLEEALDLAIYLTAEILKRKTIITKKYKYLCTAREIDRENDSYEIESVQRLNWGQVQNQVARKIIDKNTEQTDVYIDTCFELYGERVIGRYSNGHCSINKEENGYIRFNTMYFKND